MTVLLVLVLVSIATISAQGQGSVLVLGSGGMIGRHMVEWLQARNYAVLEVKNREHIDLRQHDALAVFDDKPIDFVIFLACEVGGAKFIASSSQDVQLAIVQHNIQIYQTVFPYLQRRKLPFVFTSSYLQHLDTAYGSIKRVGEQWIKHMGQGKIARLWNIYGYENIGQKSHVIPDWIDSCLSSGEIRSRTDGFEERQFLHGSDCANGLGLMMENYNSLPVVTDLSVSRWIMLRDMADMIVSKIDGVLGKSCPVVYADDEAQARHRENPNLSGEFYQHWIPEISLEAGIDDLIAKFLADEKYSHLSPDEPAACESESTCV